MSETPGVDLILVPQTGELIDPDDAGACLRALGEVRELDNQLYRAKQALQQALVSYSQRVGSRTVDLDDGGRFVREGGPAREYAAAQVQEGLRAAGMPEERIREIVVTEITVKVNGTEAQKAARANPEYRRVLEEAAVEVDRPYRIRFVRGGTL